MRDGRSAKVIPTCRRSSRGKEHARALVSGVPQATFPWQLVGNGFEPLRSDKSDIKIRRFAAMWTTTEASFNAQNHDTPASAHRFQSGVKHSAQLAFSRVTHDFARDEERSRSGDHGVDGFREPRLRPDSITAPIDESIWAF